MMQVIHRDTLLDRIRLQGLEIMSPTRFMVKPVVDNTKWIKQAYKAIYIPKFIKTINL